MRHETQRTAPPGRDMELLQRQIRTIVVDDSAIALQTVCSVAGRAQNLVIIGTATNGNAALEMVRTLHPDLVLLDVEMPVMSGIEATSCIVREAPETRVVIVTVHDTPELRRVCRERGAHGFVAKTALKDELPAVVRQLFGNGHL
jgi:DNA-binding NarL/FixJ family response regulator